MMQKYHHNLCLMKGQTLKVITINFLSIFFIMIYVNTFSARIVNIWHSLPNPVVEACSVNAFKACLDKIWSHQDVKFDLAADLTGIGNRSEQI